MHGSIKTKESPSCIC